METTGINGINDDQRRFGNTWDENFLAADVHLHEFVSYQNLHRGLTISTHEKQLGHLVQIVVDLWRMQHNVPSSCTLTRLWYNDML